MKKKIFKRLGLILIPLAFVFAVFASETGDCSTTTIFWGESCCTYTSTGETGGTEIYRKCCTYRFWLIWSACETTYVGPI